MSARMDRLAVSHAAQIRGADAQTAAIDAGGSAEDMEEFRRLIAEPSEDCNCAACRAHNWRGE